MNLWKVNNMTLPSGYCSRCGCGFLKCECESFHPNYSENRFSLSDNEVLAFYNYFLKRAGYISPEFDSEVLKIIKKIENFLGA